ncbi:extended synaptotagmin-1-like [Boleophthalmus pectinirostris]|uniref:extended synaptotagmin-1-like n=1 Tax=Boleophthalmus pectinirostris TaxID=150288 RepID=UPI00242D38F4|nr:extended synaptotagmin-1-like [Boleophthalmus pectinirostris]
MSGQVLLCIQGCDSSMWVRAALRATGPQGLLQDSHNGSPRPDAIAGIPTRNRDALVQGTDTLAAAPQSIHQSLRDGNCKRPQQSPSQWALDETWPPGMTLVLTLRRYCEIANSAESTESDPHATPDSDFGTEGVLRIHLLEAQNLIAKDNFMGGMVKGKSDPYVKIRVAGITFRSHTIKENLNPIWNELYEVILTQLPGQEIQFELFDKDIDQDDFLGRFKLSLRDIISVQCIDTWYTLNDVKSGRVHLVLEWLPRVTDLFRLEPVLQYQSQQSYQNKAVPSSALLFVYVERAHGLPLKKNGKEPKAGAEVILKNVSYKTKIFERSTSPRWDEAFHFLVRDPRDEILTVKLSHSWGQGLGSVTLPLRQVLSEPGLLLDRWFSLDGALPESQILLRFTLKILDTQLALCRKVEGDVIIDEVIPKWDPSHLDLKHRGGLSIAGENGGGVAGQVKLTIGYSIEESRLFITIHACRALAPCSKDGADPYVSFVLLPDKKATTKRRTATKKRDLNPEFNERFDFDFSLEESAQRKLDLSVKHNVSFISRERELIGKMQLDMDQIDLKTSVTQWYDLVAEAN